jgi:hypothetical protein
MGADLVLVPEAGELLALGAHQLDQHHRLAVIHGTTGWQAVADRVIYTRYKNVYVADGPVWTQSARP